MCYVHPFNICSILIPPGLHFEQLRNGVSVREDVGSVELCVSYRGDNVPPSIDGTIRQENFGRQNEIHYCCNVIMCVVIKQRGVLINMQSCTNTKILYRVHQELIGVMKGVREHVVKITEI